MSLGCGGGPSTTKAPKASPSEFANLCRAVGAEGGKLSRDKFLAQARDKKAAAELFDACDANQDQVITEEEATPGYMESLKSQAIRLTTPTGP